MKDNQERTVSLVNQDEQTAAPAASEEQQTPAGSEQGQSDQVMEQTSDEGIPQKFVGKPAMEVIEAYKKLESDRGRMANELGSIRKEREMLEAKYRELERSVMRHNSMPTQAPPNQVASQSETDPLSVFDAQFDEDPKAAIREALRTQQEGFQQRQRQLSQQQLAAEAQEYYWKQKKENQDYARREPLMQQLVSEFQDVIRPEYLNSVKVLKALDLMSRGADLEFYTKSATEKAQRNGSSVREEKRRAQSESATGEGDMRVSFDKLSLEDMAKALGRSDD